MLHLAQLCVVAPRRRKLAPHQSRPARHRPPLSFLSIRRRNPLANLSIPFWWNDWQAKSLVVSAKRSLRLIAHAAPSGAALKMIHHPRPMATKHSAFSLLSNTSFLSRARPRAFYDRYDLYSFFFSCLEAGLYKNHGFQSFWRLVSFSRVFLFFFFLRFLLSTLFRWIPHSFESFVYYLGQLGYRGIYPLYIGLGLEFGHLLSIPRVLFPDHCSILGISCRYESWSMSTPSRSSVRQMAKNWRKSVGGAKASTA